MDMKYTVKEGLRFAVQGPETVAVILGSAALDIPVDLLHIAMAFARPSTVESAYRTLDVDSDLQSFASAVDTLIARGVLEPVRDRRAPSLLTLLSSRIDREVLREHLSNGRLVVIPDAFPVEFAEAVYADLIATPWLARDAQGFRYCAVDLLDGRSETLTRLHNMWQASRDDMTDVSGTDCSGGSRASAAWYRPGDYSVPHNDTRSGVKAVAFNWYLTKDWREDWGGSLFWCPTGQHVYPLFNTLSLFRVMPSNLHAVCHVSPRALGRRMSINGFFQKDIDFDPFLALPESAAAPLVTRPIYGFDGGDNSVVVL